MEIWLKRLKKEQFINKRKRSRGKTTDRQTESRTYTNTNLDT